MKLRYQPIQIFLLLAVMSSLLLAGCEGIEDWSELKNVKILTAKSEVESSIPFKRYTEPGLSTQPVVEYIVDESSKYSKLYRNEIRKVCDYTKIPFNYRTVTSWNNSLLIAPATRVLIVHDTKKLSNASISKLIDFVSEGGTLFIPFASEDKRMSYLLGFKPEAEYATDTQSAGWYFSTPMLPCLKGKPYNVNLKFYGFAAQNFSKKVKILATACNNKKYPAVVENTIGSGRVLLYNTSGDYIKADRGFLFAGILKGLEGIPYPIANTATIFLDDFPAPQYDIKAEPIKSEFNMSTADFVEKVWWPDMKSLAKDFKIPYAAMLTFDYRNKIYPPFTLEQWNTIKVNQQNKIQPLTDWLVSDVAKNGHELAFHGYNHVSLTKELWKNQQFIETAMNTVKKKWKLSDYGKLPTTYVPPSNIIDKTGLVQLKKSMPSIKYLCSLYLGDIKDGGNREFDFDPYEKDIFDYPRISDGFYFADDKKYNQQSVYLFTGIWTHFVHPDDVYQIPSTANNSAGDFELRNRLNYGWHKTKGSDKAMYPEFKSYLKQMTVSYPQMRFLNGNEAATVVINWRAARYSHSSEKGLYTVKQINADAKDGKQYWFMYGSPGNAEKIEGQLKSQQVLFSKTPFMDGYLYSVYSNKSKITVIDLKYKNPKEKALQEKIDMLVAADFTKFNIAANKFLTGATWVDDSDKKMKLELASLKKKMLSSPVIDSVIWNKYAKYQSWEKNRSEIWEFYEAFVAKNPSKANIMYSKELDRVIGYLTDESKEKWMYEQVKVSPKNKEILDDYVSNFNTEENREKIKGVLKSLTKADPTPLSYLNYIKHLLLYYPDQARTELENKKPTAELAEVATQIVWLYADATEYKKAIEWSDLSNDIDFVTKMNWYIESGRSKELEKVYSAYIAKNPEDYKAKILMSSVYHELGRFKDSWVLANSLPESDEKEVLRKMLNKDVLYENSALQQDLIANHVALFYPDVLRKLIRADRLAKGDYIDYSNTIETNQANTSIQKNVLSYSFFDKKSNLHSISATYTKYYRLKLIERFDQNFENTLVGLQYKYTTADRDEKPKYWARARFEVNKKGNPYGQAGIGYSISKNSKYRAAELNFFPVETAPGMNQKMYQLQMNLYQDFYLFKIINTSISFEGTYYTNGLLSKDTIYTGPAINPNRFARQVITQIDPEHAEVANFNDAVKGALTLRMMLNNGVVRKSKLIPFLEGQYSQASREQPLGFPYWMIKSRLYGGGGLGWEVGIPNFQSRIEGGFFFDDYSKNFKRLAGTLQYQIFDFTALTVNVEIFEQSKYYSNSVQFGIKYNLKKRYKKN